MASPGGARPGNGTLGLPFGRSRSDTPLAIGCEAPPDTTNAALAIAGGVEDQSELGDEAEPAADIMPGPNPVTLTWIDLDPEAATHTVSTQPSALIRVRNDGAEALTIDVVARGDRGTTRTFAVPVEVVLLEPSSETDLVIDLAPFLVDAAPYASSVRVSGVVYEAESDARRDKAFSLPLYFHQLSESETAIYGSTVLEGSFGAGDYAGLAPAAEDEHRVRVVDYEEPAQDAVEEALLGDGEGIATSNSPSLTASSTSTTYAHTLCVLIEYDGPDSGFENFGGFTEDHWIDPPLDVLAHGVRVKIDTTIYDASSNGCVYFNDSAPSFSATVTGYTRSTVDSNYVRLHDAAVDVDDPEPGSAYSAAVSNVPFVYTTPTYLEVGNGGYRWEGFAAFARALYRYHDGISGVKIQVNDKGSCTTNNAQYAGFFGTRKESYLRMRQESCNPASLREKFTVGHEYGHAYLAQFAAAFQNPDSDTHNVGTSSCGMGAGYDNSTKEWSSLAFKEGYAHFISARIWNENQGHGTMRWSPDTIDLERWNVGNDPRGYLKNNCCAGSPSQCASWLDGTGTLQDWVRGLWDLHTTIDCSDSPDREGLANLYDEVLAASGLQNGNFWLKSVNKVATLFPDCDTLWDNAGCHNGLDEQGTIQSGACN